MNSSYNYENIGRYIGEYFHSKIGIRIESENPISVILYEVQYDGIIYASLEVKPKVALLHFYCTVVIGLFTEYFIELLLLCDGGYFMIIL